jgi:hypothetical protein
VALLNGCSNSRSHTPVAIDFLSKYLLCEMLLRKDTAPLSAPSKWQNLARHSLWTMVVLRTTKWVSKT